MSARQDDASIEANRAFFEHEHDRYCELVQRMPTYRHVREAIDAEIAGLDLMLDVGNGGTFDYDTSLVKRIVAVDLFLEDLPKEHFPDNVIPRNGDALALADDDGTYDGVLFALVFHHLTGTSADAVLANTERSLHEAWRVLKPGGRLVVVESCVPRWFYGVERMLFPALRAVASTRLLKHPATLQLPVAMLERRIGERFANVRRRKIRHGALILQFGWRWPVLLTPARMHLIVATKA